MIIDTHAHYDDEQFDEDREEILGKMQDAGIGMIMDAGSTILSWDKIVKLTEEYPFVYGAPFFCLSVGTGDRGKLVCTLKPRCGALHTRFDNYIPHNE